VPLVEGAAGACERSAARSRAAVRRQQALAAGGTVRLRVWKAFMRHESQQ